MCSPTISKGTWDNPDFELAKLFNFKGKVALVADGGSSMGLIATQALALNGAKVHIEGRVEEKLETVARRYGHDIAGEIILITADISKKEDIRRFVSDISSREKCLCILINNGGHRLEHPTNGSHDSEGNVEELV
jgi:NADP-dependent 3-hydroxy acid dehydrogenase YdfG